MILRYLVSGASATIVHFLTLAILVELLYISPIIATTIGFIFAVGVNYPLQYYWVFKNSTEHQSVFFRYIVVTICTMLVNIIVFWFLFDVLNFWYLFAQLFSTILVISLNYIINKKFTFISQKML